MPRPATWTRFAVDTFLEGCVGEPLAALEALRALRGGEVPTVRRVLEGIVEDAWEHVAMAWVCAWLRR